MFQMSGDGAKNTHTQSSKSPPDDYRQSMGQPKALSFYRSKTDMLEGKKIHFTAEFDFLSFVPKMWAPPK